MTTLTQIDLATLLATLSITQRRQVYWDIETGPAPKDEILQFFRPEKVKIEHLVDADKIASKIEQARTDFIERAPLFAQTARVLGVGYGIQVSPTEFATHLDVIDDTTIEKHLLENFWSIFHLVKRGGSRLIGFNTDAFDFPMMKRRSWVHNLDTPIFLTKYGKTEDFCIDLKKEWKLNVWGFDNEISLNHLCKTLQVPGKKEGMHGGDFWKTFAEDRPKALEYLQSDITALYFAAQKMRVAHD